MKRSVCRFCNAELTSSFADLGMSPPANSYVSADHLGRMERFYPLHAWVCDRCLLVQLEEFETPEQIFSDYAYFSSYSDTWLAHAKQFAEQMMSRLRLDRSSLVVEVASNDGYLLQYFLRSGVPVLGIEPAKNVAAEAERRGIRTVVEFFGTRLASRLAAEGRRADLVAANNVLAHVPDLNDFVRGLKLILKPGGIVTVEVPHLLNLIQQNQFDTIYHEHFSYFSFMVAERVFAAHGLTVFDVEQLATHGGSLRIYARHADNSVVPVTESVMRLRKLEEECGLSISEIYRSFATRVKATKRALLGFLIEAANAGKQVVGYGAPAKGNTLLNYCGVRTDLLAYTVDRSPHKQGRFLPGVHIPIHAPERILETRPDFVLILPWNLKEEIVEQMSTIRNWGGKFAVPIPELKVLD